MNLREVNVEHLRSGMMLWWWTKEARDQQGNFAGLQAGPDGIWSAMVMTNDIAAPRKLEGFAYPAVHEVSVFFWKATGQVTFETLTMTAGTLVKVIE